MSVLFASLIDADFAAATVLITFGAVLGRISPAQLLVIAVVECLCYSGNTAFNAYVLSAADVGGSMVIHTFGAYFGLAASFVLLGRLLVIIHAVPVPTTQTSLL